MAAVRGPIQCVWHLPRIEVAALLPPLDESPQDARGQVALAEADAAVYRLGLHALAVPGLPERVTVSDVGIQFVRGPVLAQHTLVRQRYGFPIVFDKAMRRVPVGDGELLAIVWIQESPVPGDLEAAFDRWRARAQAAAGMIASIFDERVAGPGLFEDAVLLRDGQFVGGADVRARLRTFLPFDVTAADTAALEGLANADLAEGEAAARAARLYRRAALEGPTADAYAMLWVAAECFSEQRSPSRTEIEAALRAAGLDPDTLPISVGRLIGLRGEVQHFGREVDDYLRAAFYEMEAVVRALIRQAVGIQTGWWAASDNAAGFVDPFDEAVSRLQGPGSSEWHDARLPPAKEGIPERLPRKIPNPLDDPRVRVDEGFEGARELIAAVVLDAVEWLEQNAASLDVHIGAPAEAPPDSTVGASATAIWIREKRLVDLGNEEHPEVLVNLVWDLHAIVPAAIVQQSGLISQGQGVILIEALGAFCQYRRLVTFGEFEADSLQIPSGNDARSVGKIAGWGAAGDSRALRALERLPSTEQGLARSFIHDLREDEPGAPTKVLDLAAGLGRSSSD